MNDTSKVVIDVNKSHVYLDIICRVLRNPARRHYQAKCMVYDCLVHKVPFPIKSTTNSITRLSYSRIHQRTTSDIFIYYQQLLE